MPCPPEKCKAQDRRTAPQSGGMLTGPLKWSSWSCSTFCYRRVYDGTRLIARAGNSDKNSKKKQTGIRGQILHPRTPPTPENTLLGVGGCIKGGGHIKFCRVGPQNIHPHPPSPEKTPFSRKSGGGGGCIKFRPGSNCKTRRKIAKPAGAVPQVHMGAKFYTPTPPPHP